MSIPPYASPAVPPPKIEKGEIVEVSNLTYEVVEGNYGPQYQFDGQLENGFNARAWVKKYDQPTVKTKIVHLCQLIDRQHGSDSATIEEALARLISYGKIFFNCSGHRDVDGEKYPSFNVYADKLPGIKMIEQEKITPSIDPDQPKRGDAFEVSDQAKIWLITNKNVIGEAIPPELHNTTDKAIFKELEDLGLFFYRDFYPHIHQDAGQIIE